MSMFYLDTSAIVKRYFPEAGSGWVHTLADPAAGNNLLLCEATLAETAAAIAAKHRASGGITLAERDGILRRFLQHCDDEYILVPLNRAVINRAVLLTQSHRLRGYDAVQLAAALLVNAQYLAAGLPTLTFITADNDLLTAAVAEGLATDNPNAHP
jgi:predicted nucleic acid-binding protein